VGRGARGDDRQLHHHACAAGGARKFAKVFGVPPDEVNHFTKRLPHRPVCEILAAIQHLPECRTLPVNDEPWKRILQVALRPGRRAAAFGDSSVRHGDFGGGL